MVPPSRTGTWVLPNAPVQARWADVPDETTVRLPPAVACNRSLGTDPHERPRSNVLENPQDFRHKRAERFDAVGSCTERYDCQICRRLLRALDLLVNSDKNRKLARRE